MSASIKFDMGLGMGQVEISGDSAEELLEQLTSFAAFTDQEEEAKTLREVEKELISAISVAITDKDYEGVSAYSQALQRIMR